MIISLSNLKLTLKCFKPSEKLIKLKILKTILTIFNF
jgi:hypothetical protein